MLITNQPSLSTVKMTDSTRSACYFMFKRRLRNKLLVIFMSVINTKHTEIIFKKRCDT